MKLLQKFWVIPVFSFLSLIPGDTFGQWNDSIRKMLVSPQKVHTVIKSNPLAILVSSMPMAAEYRIIVEQAIHPKQSTQVGFSLLGKSPILYMVEDTALPNGDRFLIRGWRFQAAYRFYTSRHQYAPNGFYISPLISMASQKISTRYLNSQDIYYKGFHYNTSLHFGYQLIVLDQASLDVFTGFGFQEKKWYQHNDRMNIRLPVNLSDLELSKSNFKLSGGFNIGICF